MKKISASEIGTYLFCERAWWYQKQGNDSENIAELGSGKKLHARHGRAVFTSGLYQMVGFILLLVALVMFAIALVNLVI